uniref:Retrotransposon Copia-like N-terminal domain-containing protein n=1 Tax=Opuntia streptacantha TaxID=393608 RepID=A0A7C9D2G2_OPUST
MEQSDASSNQRQGDPEIYNNDPLYLQSSDHPGAQIVAVKLTGPNFMKWSRTVKIALRTKGKLGFIDGSCPKPGQDTSKLAQWIKCDSMVVSWLLNSMVPDLSEAFLYVNTAQELWDELSERFGESNGPLLYQLEKDIADLYQGSDSVAVYYTKL